MATYTTKYHLKKPEDTDFFDIADHNSNMDILDKCLEQTETALGKAADKETQDTIHTKVGTTTDAGGTITSGTLMGKLNTLLSVGAIKSIQRGTANIKITEGQRTIPMAMVVPTKSLVLLNGMGETHGDYIRGMAVPMLNGIDATSISVKVVGGERYEGNVDVLFSWQVIEFN